MKNILIIFVLTFILCSCSDNPVNSSKTFQDNLMNGYFEIEQTYNNLPPIVIMSKYVNNATLDSQKFTTLDSIPANLPRGTYTTGFFITGYGEHLHINTENFSYNGDSNFTLSINLNCNTSYNITYLTK